MGSGVDTDPMSTGANTLPHASVIFPGGPGSTASDAHVTVLEPAAGGVNVVLKFTV
jgi:hypothetical protein